MAGPARRSDSTLLTLSSNLADAAERAGRSIVAIHARRRIPASGVHWRPGVVVAAQHTLERDEEITVTLADGSTVPAELAGRDPGTDLAVLRLDAGSTPVAERAEGEPRVGALVLALGRPWTGPVTAALGIISAVGGEFRTWHGGVIDRLVRLDIAVHDGFSGGALVDGAGHVLGVNTSGLTRGGALTLPIATVDRTVEQLLTQGYVRRGYLGVAMQPIRLPAALRDRAGTALGLLVVHVEAGGPAEGAGVLPGDILLAIDGRTIRELRDVAAWLGPDTVGRQVTVKLIRGGQVVDVPVTVGEREANAA